MLLFDLDVPAHFLRALLFYLTYKHSNINLFLMIATVSGAHTCTSYSIVRITSHITFNGSTTPRFVSVILAVQWCENWQKVRQRN